MTTSGTASPAASKRMSAAAAPTASTSTTSLDRDSELLDQDWTPDVFAVLALQAGACASWRLVGRYGDFDTAVAARIEDVLSQLEANDGWLITADHLIIGPDLDGSIGMWPQTSSLGADPGSDRIPDPYDRASWRQWLQQTHQASP